MPDDPSRRPVDASDPNAATRVLWGGIARPFDTRDAARALFGLRASDVNRLAGAAIAGSTEATDLVEAIPDMIRSLSVTTVRKSERCQGEVRGTVLWSETMAARAGTAGATDVFVCMTARRAYDTPQNRVLVSALDAIRQAAREANPRGDEWGGDERILAAAANAESARRHLEHRALRDVSRRRPSRRDYASTMTGRRARTYVPAIRVLDRVADPLGVDDLLPYTDPRTAWQHWIVVTLGSRLRARRSAVGPWRVTADGELRAGPLAYRHPATAARVAGSLHGIFTSDLLIDVPDPLGAPDLDTAHAKLAARSQGRTALLVTSMNDIERAVELLSGGSPDLP